MFMGEGPPRLRPPQQKPGSIAVPQPVIRSARSNEYDQVARVWMDSWVSTGLEDASDSLLTKLRARVLMEVEKGWSLYVADDNGRLAAMLAMHLPGYYLDQLFVAAKISGKRPRAPIARLHAATTAR